MRKKNNQSLADRIAQTSILQDVLFGCMLIAALVLAAYMMTDEKRKLASAEDQIVMLESQLADTFTVKGITTALTEIDGEEHCLVCYHVTVSEFAFADDEKARDLIGAEEGLIPFMYPDGTITYHSAYYEALSDYRGMKVQKEFMDCGPANGELSQLAGTETPLTVEFRPWAGVHSGILDTQDRTAVPTVAIDR